MKFLSARWSNLFLATYAVPPELLTPRLPAGLELDQREGQCFVSLVAFDFLDTRVLGIPWPGFRNFPEVNLRFYVRQGERRGVVFVRELVPQRFVAWMARVLYNEPYVATPMTNSVVENETSVSVEHTISFGGKQHRLRVVGEKPSLRPAADSVEHFFKEHEWGFGSTRGGQTMCYRVEHPVWDVYRVRDWSVDLDWAAVYGPEWGLLQHATPYSTVLAVGSRIAVFSAT